MGDQDFVYLLLGLVFDHLGVGDFGAELHVFLDEEVDLGDGAHFLYFGAGGCALEGPEGEVGVLLHVVLLDVEFEVSGLAGELGDVALALLHPVLLALLLLLDDAVPVPSLN